MTDKLKTGWSRKYEENYENVKKKHPLQVTKCVSRTGFEDLDVLARDIVDKGISCAIYDIDDKIVLMRDIERDETIFEWYNGVRAEVLLIDSIQHKLADDGIYDKRKIFKKYFERRQEV